MTNKYALLLCCGIVFGADVHAAGDRSSASYNISSEAISLGGGRSTSASYRVDATLGEIGGTGTRATPPILARYGYIGQLFEVTGLAVTANPATIDEGGARQLQAGSTLDDGTSTALNPSSVSWNVLNGPVASISSGGVAQAAAVYQNTTASVRGTYQGQSGDLVLSVLDIFPDNYGAYANDGIDDSWQVQYFGEDNPVAGPAFDPDGDGQNNLFEFTAGLVPTNPASRFNLAVGAVPGQPNQKRIVFSPIVAGRTYVPQFRLNPTTGQWAPLQPYAQSDNGAERTITDLEAIEAAKFYRIQITRP